jgi:hypothetical protein
MMKLAVAYLVALPALALAAAPAAPNPAPAAAFPPKAAAPRESAWTDEERVFCSAELEIVEKRAKLFEAQGLAPDEIARRNASATAAVADCRKRYAAQARRAREEQEDLAETDRRAGPNATEKERAATWKQVRRERLASKSPATLTAEERAELAEGIQQELAETHATLDTAHARDGAFMRQVHSALACYHGDRHDELTTDIAHEESLIKVGSGDRNRLYALRSDLRQSDEVLARSREAARGFSEGLARCSEQRTAILTHCLGIRFEKKSQQPACESEEIQQYLRFIN